jgi:hypothetical protein
MSTTLPAVTSSALAPALVARLEEHAKAARGALAL